MVSIQLYLQEANEWHRRSSHLQHFLYRTAFSQNWSNVIMTMLAKWKMSSGGIGRTLPGGAATYLLHASGSTHTILVTLEL